VLVFGACSGTGAPRFAFAAEGTKVDFEGHLDLVGVTQDDEINSNFFNFGENAFHSSRIRLIANAKVHDHVAAFLEFLSDDANEPRVFGAFARLSDPKGRDIHLELGKIPLHTGAFPNRSYASKNNLISSPAIYQYHTNLRDDELPATTDQLVANRGNGYFTNYGSGLGSPGDGHSVPVLYDNCWDFGAVVIGTVSPLEFAFGATNGTVGNPVNTDSNDGKQVLGRIGVVPAPWVRAGVSGSRGAYPRDPWKDSYPPAPRSRTITRSWRAPTWSFRTVAASSTRSTSRTGSNHPSSRTSIWTRGTSRGRSPSSRVGTSRAGTIESSSMRSG